VVMRVRTQQPALWRAEAYDTFDGQKWTASRRGTAPINSGGPGPAAVPGNATPPAVPTRQVVQTFYIAAQQPNVVFAAWQPRQIYFPAPLLREDDYGSIRSPLLLEEGMVYSVVSQVPETTPALLRASPPDWPT